MLPHRDAGRQPRLVDRYPEGLVALAQAVVLDQHVESISGSAVRPEHERGRGRVILILPGLDVREEQRHRDVTARRGARPQHRFCQLSCFGHLCGRQGEGQGHRRRRFREGQGQHVRALERQGDRLVRFSRIVLDDLEPQQAARTTRALQMFAVEGDRRTGAADAVAGGGPGRA